MFRPHERRRSADIVNLGFVLNVIEDAEERRATLRAAFSLTRRALVVSVMLGYQSKRAQFAAYEDGVRTQRNTFQKYYAQDDFRSYVEATLGENAVPITPGTCIVFRDPVDEQLLLPARQQVRREWRLLRRKPDRKDVAGVIESHREQLDVYWLRALELGRPPATNECPETQSLTRLVGSWRRVHDWVGRLFDPQELEAAAIGRQEDLLVYLALAPLQPSQALQQVAGATPAGRPAFLREHHQSASGQETKHCSPQATAHVSRRRRSTSTNSLGSADSTNATNLAFHQPVLGECLPVIRIYVGCALQLFGDANSVDLIKVHLQSGKASFLVYNAFEGKETPTLPERIKVDLPRLRVEFFDYRDMREPQRSTATPRATSRAIEARGL